MEKFLGQNPREVRQVAALAEEERGERLWRLAQEGNREAEVEILKMAHEVARPVAAQKKIVGADADEFHSNVSMAVVRGLDTFRGKAKLTTWLFTVAQNAAIDLFRRRSRPERFSDVVSMAGLQILSVESESAHAAGFRRGDRIIAVNDTPIEDKRHLKDRLHAAGETAEFLVEDRDRARRTVVWRRRRFRDVVVRGDEDVNGLVERSTTPRNRRLRGQRVHHRPENVPTSGLARALHREALGKVRRAVRALSLADLTIVAARYWHERSWREIARDIGSTLDAVRMRGQRILVRLLRILHENPKGP